MFYVSEHTCNLSGKTIPHGDYATLSFIVSSKSPMFKEPDSFIVTKEGNIENVHRIQNFGQHSAFSEYTPLRFNFSVKTLSYQHQLEDTKENIVNLKKLANFLTVDFFTKVEDGLTFLHDDKDDEDLTFIHNKVKFNSEVLQEDIDDAGNCTWAYQEIFDYIIRNIDTAYIEFMDNAYKMEYTLIRQDIFDYVTSPEFTDNHYGFNLLELEVKILDIHEDDRDESFIEDYILGCVENLTTWINLPRFTDSAEEFNIVMKNYLYASYIDLLYRDTRTKLAPAVPCYIPFRDNELLIDIMRGPQDDNEETLSHGEDS